MSGAARADVSLTTSAGNPLNRLSYLRSSGAFLASSLTSEKAQYVVYDNLNPLTKSGKDGVKTLQTVKWADVKSYIAGEDGDATAVFDGVDGKDEKSLGAIPSHWRKKGDAAQLSAEDKRAFFINVSLLSFSPLDRLLTRSSHNSKPLLSSSALTSARLPRPPSPSLSPNLRRLRPSSPTRRTECLCGLSTSLPSPTSRLSC